jgi:signal peptide peptidase SppA
MRSDFWAIERRALEQLVERSRAPHAAAGDMPLRAKRADYELHGSVAVIDVSGVLMPRPDLFERAFLGATDTEDIARAVTAAEADAAVKSILIDFSSPGGAVAGVQELANLVASVQKPVVSRARDGMTSAAFWIGCAARSVWLSSETALIGSIGVLALHVDLSERERMLGIRITPIAAGRFKTVGSPHAPLPDDHRATIQSQVDQIYTIFVNDVARFRGVTLERALSMADGKVYLGRQALAAGLADGIATLDQLIGQLEAGTLPHRSQARVQASAPAISIEERCRATWARDPKVREEFIVFSAFLGWERAQVRRV